MISLTLDEKTLSAALAGQLDFDPIIENLGLPASCREVKCILLNEHGYMLSRELQPADALLTISLLPDGPLFALSAAAREEALGRILKCTSRLVAGRSSSIPVAWRAYHKKNRISFQANRFLRSSDGGRTDAGRVIMEISNDSGPRIFAFSLEREGRQDLALFQPDLALHRGALDGVGEAFSTPEKEACPKKLEHAVDLGHQLESKTVTPTSYDEWYKVRLTKAQRQFVDYSASGSLRLVGPAGSGKTVTLVIKCLKELKAASSTPNSLRILFLTHASATVDLVENIVLSMDPDSGVNYLASERPSLLVTTLYSLANTQMRYDLDSLTPLSLDGHEGHAIQADILNDVIEEFKLNEWIAYKSGCHAPFIAYMDAPHDSLERRFFLWELLNEFACVLDAEGVRSGTARREQYLGEKRRNWMMLLQSREEREVVLQLYDRFGAWLRDVKAIGSDQMISDFLSHLDSYRWEATRDKEGFDIVCVDELHLFNRQERMLFTYLLRDPKSQPKVFMAYDAKQSPRDTFLQLPSGDAQKYDYWKDARLGKVEKIELVDVFRYTPQIARALTLIDQSFPGQDLDEEWPAYSGVSRTSDGPLPTICEIDSLPAMYNIVFRRAKALQRKLEKGQRVAVLCVSYENFRKYLSMPDFREFYNPITSRDEVSNIPRSGKRFLFSMPEFVAGLQFDTVMVIDVNRHEVPDGPYSAAALRKFASQVYLGTSRAERHLELYSSKRAGGTASIISHAVLAGAVKQVDVKDIAV